MLHGKIKWIVGCWLTTLGPPFSEVVSVCEDEIEGREEMERLQEETPGIPWFHEIASIGLEYPGDRFYPEI